MLGKTVFMWSLSLLLVGVGMGRGLASVDHAFEISREGFDRKATHYLHRATGIGFPARLRPFSIERVDVPTVPSWMLPEEDEAEMQEAPTLEDLILSAAPAEIAVVEYGAPLEKVNIYVGLGVHTWRVKDRLRARTLARASAYMFSEELQDYERIGEARATAKPFVLESHGMELRGVRYELESVSNRAIKPVPHTQAVIDLEFEGY